MNILHTVEFYSPHTGGSEEVVQQVSERLLKKGHRVTVATSADNRRVSQLMGGVAIKEFRIVGNEAEGLRGETREYQEFLRDGTFDVIMNYGAQLWSTDLVLPLLSKLKSKKVLAPCGFSGLFNPKYQAYFSRMPERLARYDHVIFHSHTYRDTEYARHHGIEHYTVIPNGASKEEFGEIPTGGAFRRRFGLSPDTPLVLAVSNHTKLKGHKLIIEAFRMARVESAVLVIVGKPFGYRTCLPSCKARAFISRISSFGKKRILLLSPPRCDVVQAYQEADLFLLGSDLECSPVVLFEAMASSTPFITTDCGNTREIVDWSKGGIVLPGKKQGGGQVLTKPESMAKAIEEVLFNRDLRESLGKSGRKAWAERFTWDRITDEYEAVYQKLL